MTPWTVVRGILQARILEWVAFPSPGDLSHPGVKTRYPTLQADSLPPGKPKNTGVGSLTLDLSDPGIKPCSALQSDSLPSELPDKKYLLFKSD